MIAGIKTADHKKPRISYWSKTKCICPICKKSFQKEEMLSGNGRMIAGPLTDELHRIYEPSKKFGQIDPLIYAVGACPHCHSAFFWNDFAPIKDNGTVDRILMKQNERKEMVNTIFPYYSLTRERNLLDGAAMCYLALLTYQQADLSFIPTLKSGILTLRLAWLCNDLDKRCPEHNYSFVADVFYQKALFFYEQALINETSRVEKSSELNAFGPDVDTNYGWDGVVYLSALLEYKYGQKENHEIRIKKLAELKTSIARIFGLGKSSKSKPGPLLEHSRKLYDNISKELADEVDVSFDED